MTYRAHIDQQGGVSLSREALAAAGLSIGDKLVVEHVEPGLIRLRRSESTTWSEAVDRHDDNESVGDLEEWPRQAEGEVANELIAKLEE